MLFVEVRKDEEKNMPQLFDLSLFLSLCLSSIPQPVNLHLGAFCRWANPPVKQTGST